MLYEEKDTQTANRSKADKAANGASRKPIIINNDTTNNIGNRNDTEQSNNLGIVVSNVTAKWTDAQTENSLENINLTVKPRRLVAVIGPVGAGKVYYNTNPYYKRVINNIIDHFFQCRVRCYKPSYENYRFLKVILPCAVLCLMHHKNHGYLLVLFNKTFYSVCQWTRTDIKKYKRLQIKLCYFSYSIT